jgi:X-Pro dipeptidyl-peptidase
MALLALAALTVVALAGCGDTDPQTAPADVPETAPTQVELSEATHGVGDFISASVPSVDGVGIHIDVLLPDGPGPFPTIVDYTPYSALGSNANAAQNELVGLPNPSFYVSRGYATATAHVRGTGESGGCLTIGAPIEGQDGYALVEWIAAQPWSSGKVAFMGTSYDGTTPLETAVWQPPHLTTIVPISPVTEWYRYYFENGLHRNNEDPPPGSSNTDPALWAGIGIVPGPRTLASGGVDDVTCQAEFAMQDTVNDDYNAYWHDRDHHAKAGKITVPVLFAHGWEDGNVAATGIETLWENITAEKRLWVQQHGHGVPGSKTGYHEYVHRWLDHYLLGLDNGALLLPDVVIEDNLARYRAEDVWPPADQAFVRFNLTGDALAPSAGESQSIDILDTGVPPQQDGPDRHSFASAPLEEPLHIAGTPRLQLRLGSNLPTGQVTVRLTDVAPDGGATVDVSRGFIDLRHRESLETGKDLSPGTLYDVQWDLHPNDHVVQAGHRLVLSVAANDVYVRQGNLRPTLTLESGAGASWLDLPVVDDSVRSYAEAPPAPWQAPGEMA